MQRRTVRARLALLVLPALTLAACGDDADQTTESTAPPAVSTDTTAGAEPGGAEPTSEPSTVETSVLGSEPAAAATRSVEHALGTSEVPADPQRIVVVDRRGTLAFMIELGFEPVGALEAEWLFGQPFHPLIADQAAAAGVEPIDGTDGPNLEQIAQLDPDLIIGNVRDMAETEDRLAQIAPTVGLTWDFVDPLSNAEAIGAALGVEDRAAELVADFDSAVEVAAGSTADPGTVSIVGLFAADDIRIYREHNLYGRLTTALGGQIVPSEAELAYDPEDNEVNYVSMEEIGLAAGDRTIALVNLAPEADAAYRELAANPLVQLLPGFAAGRVLEADPQLAFGAAGSTGIRAMLDQLVEFYNS